MSDIPPNNSEKTGSVQKIFTGVEVGGNLTTGDIQVVHDSSRRLSKQERTDQDFREKLLTRFKLDWLSILEKNIFSNVLIDLALENWDSRAQKISNNNEDTTHELAVNMDENIEFIFKKWESGQRLLILGEPGSGKTISLLQLGKMFYHKAQDNILEGLIPVVFHLSSWRNKQPIDEWLIEQLYTTYGFPTKRGEEWVNSRILIPLLDGFDYVDTNYQQNCIREINKFGASDLIICSRVQQRETLFSQDVQLKVDHTIYIKSLTSTQISKYLEDLNKTTLVEVLREDYELEKLATIPFWLNMMIDVYADIYEELPREGSSTERKEKLFNSYVDKNFQSFKRGKNSTFKYDKKLTMKFLEWLAKHSNSVFLIEEIQPFWLSKEQRRLYLLLTLCNGMLLGLLFGTPYGLIIHLYLSNVLELSLGPVLNGIYLGTTAGLIIGVFAQYFLKVHLLPIQTHKEVVQSWQKIRAIFWNSLNKSLYEATGIGIFVLLFCQFFVPIFIKEYTRATLLFIGVIVGAFFGVVTFVIRLLSNSLVNREYVRTLRANQGIWDSYKTAFVIAKNSTVTLIVINTLVLLLIHEIIRGDTFYTLATALILGLCSAVITGGAMAFIHDSGRSCQQHFALRIVLFMTGYTPWNYADFLDYATHLRFLNKIGGSYQFFHAIFKEYLSNLSSVRKDR